MTRSAVHKAQDDVPAALDLRAEEAKSDSESSAKSLVAASVNGNRAGNNADGGAESDSNESTMSSHSRHGIGYHNQGADPRGGGGGLPGGGVPGGDGGGGGGGGPPGDGGGSHGRANNPGGGSPGGASARSGGSGSVGEGGQIYSGPFLDKLMMLGLPYDKAVTIVKNGATSAYTFARLFGKTALKDLFGPDYSLDKVPLLVKQRIRVFHRWLQSCHAEGQDLKTIDLDIFNDDVMAVLLDEEPDDGMAKARGSSIKDSGMQLPTFNGNQPAYAVWHAKWRAFLSNMKNKEGIPLLYVIVNTKDEKPAVVQQIKAAKWTGKHYERDNFKVAQLLETALADGSTHMYACTHPGDGQSAFSDLHDTYQSDSKQENKIRDLHNKLKLIQYRGAKNFGWDKFSNTLQGYYQELSSLGEPMMAKTQVRTLIPMILHQKTKDVATTLSAPTKQPKRI